MALTGLIRKLWPKWILLFVFWTMLGLAFAGQLYLSRSKIGDPVTWGFALERALADWYVFAILSIPALWVARRFPLARTEWKQSVSVHLLAGALFSLGWMALRAAVEQWQSRGEMYPVGFAAAFSRALVATFFFNLLIYWGVIVVQHAFDYYWKFHEREIHAVELETRLTAARLQALQMQLNPHFLFNTLNAISSLMHKDVEAADRMIAQLSDLLRYTLESTGEQEVALRQELDFLDRYLQIQQARFGERLVVQRDIAPETLEARVPNLVLQPLVENAIQHGIAPHARVGRILLRAERHGDRLDLEVEDNGRGLSKDSPPRDGVGLANTRARLQQLYGVAQCLELNNAAEGGLIVRVSIPWRADENARSSPTNSQTQPFNPESGVSPGGRA
jgi:signal transduction histidine kinase